jgi:hypothetical protein
MWPDESSVPVAMPPRFFSWERLSLAPGFSLVKPVVTRIKPVSTRILHWNGLGFSFCAVGWRVDEHLGNLAR